MDDNVLQYLSKGLLYDLIIQKNARILSGENLFKLFSPVFGNQLYLQFNEELMGLYDTIMEEEYDSTIKQESKLCYLINGKVKFCN